MSTTNPISKTPNPYVNFWLVLALIFAFTLITNLIFSQSIVLAGTVKNADTLNIKAWSNGDLVINQQSTDKVYALILGEHPHYLIAFESNGYTKWGILITYGMEAETIDRPVDFSVKSNVIITKETTGFFNSSGEITYTYYGAQSYKKKF